MTRLVECVIPILPVRDVASTIAFMTETLGFHVDWNDGKIASVSRDGCAVMLQQDRGGAGTAWIWIGLQDDSLFGQARERGATVLQEPRNCSWASSILTSC